jgi:protein-tyrosine phosphatase
MDKITDAIWIGNYHDAMDRETLHLAGIKSVLCLDGCLAGKRPSEVGVERIEILELIDGEGNPPERFLRAVRLLKECATNNSPVLVHCHAGRSRSAAVVCKYFMQFEGNRLAEAMKRITSKRSACIALGLQKALDL